MDNLKLSLKPLQLWYVTYEMVYMFICRWNGIPIIDFHLTMIHFWVLSFVSFMFSIAVLIYNKKYEERKSVKRACIALAAAGVVIFCIH